LFQLEAPDDGDGAATCIVVESGLTGAGDIVEAHMLMDAEASMKANKTVV
jgi:hypothetical protein